MKKKELKAKILDLERVNRECRSILLDIRTMFNLPTEADRCVVDISVARHFVRRIDDALAPRGLAYLMEGAGSVIKLHGGGSALTFGLPIKADPTLPEDLMAVVSRNGVEFVKIDGLDSTVKEEDKDK